MTTTPLLPARDSATSLGAIGNPRLYYTLLALAVLSPSVLEAQTVGELDTYWAAVAKTVEVGDFQAYSRLYHPDAVYVDGPGRTTYPVATALAGWEQGFLDTREGKAAANVTFRFTRRLHDQTTAHETGMFRFSLKPRGGAETVSVVHFEGLLVKKDGAWLMLMEFQQRPATDEEWNAAR